MPKIFLFLVNTIFVLFLLSMSNADAISTVAQKIFVAVTGLQVLFINIAFFYGKK